MFKVVKFTNSLPFAVAHSPPPQMTHLWRFSY